MGSDRSPAYAHADALGCAGGRCPPANPARVTHGDSPDRVRGRSSAAPWLTATLTAKPHDNTGPQGTTMDGYTRLSCANGLGGDHPRNLRVRWSRCLSVRARVLAVHGTRVCRAGPWIASERLLKATVILNLRQSPNRSQAPRHGEVPRPQPSAYGCCHSPSSGCMLAANPRPWDLLPTSNLHQRGRQ